MNERLDSFMTAKGSYLKNPWPVAAKLAQLRATSAFGHLMWAAALLIITLALMEPSSSAGLNLFSRTFFWSLHLIPATIIAWVLSGWLFNLRASDRISPWVLLVVAGAVTGLMLAPISVTLELFFGVFDAAGPQSRPLSFTLDDWLNELKDELLDVPLTTAIMWPAMNAFVVWRIGSMHDDARGNTADEIQLLDGSLMPQVQIPSAVGTVSTVEKLELPESGFAPKQQESKVGTSCFLDRLPTRLGRDIIFVEAEEHYLRVTTSRGQHLLLQGFTHAIVELENNGFDGIQIHRSVWVAWKHVENVDVRMGSMSVVLSTGACLKIGRRRVKSVVAAWRERCT